MLKLIYLLQAILIYGKDCHYAFTGVDFLTNHKWMDEITDPLYDWIDEIKESVLLYRGMDVPRGVYINAQAAQFVPESLPKDDNRELLRNLRALISMTVQHIDAIATEENAPISTGDGDLYGRIGTHLQKHLGLLQLALGE